MSDGQPGGWSELRRLASRSGEAARDLELERGFDVCTQLVLLGLNRHLMNAAGSRRPARRARRSGNSDRLSRVRAPKLASTPSA
jgi:hypothetical protein